MRKILNIIIICVNFFAYCQTRNKEGDVYLIEKEFSMQGYKQVAKDSINKIYNDQVKYLPANLTEKEARDKTNTFISQFYKMEDLELYSVPVFKLKKNTQKKYSLSKNFEDFIDFKPNYSFQSIYIYHKDTLLRAIQIPDYAYESLKKNDPDSILKLYNEDRDKKLMTNFKFNIKYSKSFRNTYLEEGLKEKQQGINRKSGNFYFKIYGLTREVFEVDKLTGILYVNDVFPNPHERLPANEYIFKFIGADVIKQIVRGHFDCDPSPIAYSCYKSNDAPYVAKRKKVILDLKRIE